MRPILILFILLFFSVDKIQCQEDTSTLKTKKQVQKGNYTPLDLEDCFKTIDILWEDSTKEQVKNMTEEEFCSNAHFGFGMWMRNNWNLWKGSRLSKFFNTKNIYHADDMSGIIIKSYFRYLKKQDIKLDEQISSHISYWNAMKSPSKEQYPSGIKKLELKTVYHYKNSKQETRAVQLYYSQKTKEYWLFEQEKGFILMDDAKQKLLDNSVNNREEVVDKIYSKQQ